MKEVPSCSYRYGRLEAWPLPNASLTLRKFHDFPVTVRGEGGEKLLRGTKPKQYDTLISINVIEHVKNAFDYLSGLYYSLRPGGKLIFHDRYYSDDHIVDGDVYHPVRIKRAILDTFLEGFSVEFNNCSAAYDGRPNETGYYIIATKL